MSRGRPRTAMGTFGQVHVTDLGGRYRALTRFRDTDGRLRKVTATARSQRAAEALLKERLLTRSGYGTGGLLSMSSPFVDLTELWLADLQLRHISENTKENYRDDLRLHVRPFFEHYTLGEITTGRVEWFLKSERAVSYSRAKHSRTVLNQVFTFALRRPARLVYSCGRSARRSDSPARAAHTARLVQPGTGPDQVESRTHPGHVLQNLPGTRVDVEGHPRV